MRRNDSEPYKTLLAAAQGFLEEEPYYVSAMSNLSALIMDTVPMLNWAGFYLVRDGKLVVGPFQGKPACIHIRIGKGVCGTCVEKDEPILVPDVHRFPGHIACDSASNAEIVIPIHREGKIAAVLDLDSPVTERFSESDREGLQELVLLIEKLMQW